jgi:hypothetical protein
MPAGPVPARMLDTAGHVRAQPYRTNLSQADAPKHVTYPYILKVRNVSIRRHEDSLPRQLWLAGVSSFLALSQRFSSTVAKCIMLVPLVPWPGLPCTCLQLANLLDLRACHRATALVAHTNVACGPCSNGTLRL